MHHRAGDTLHARNLLERACVEAAPGIDRAWALVRLADLHDDPRDGLPLYRKALAEAESVAALVATIQIRLAGSMAWAEGLERGFEHADLAVRAAS